MPSRGKILVLMLTLVVSAAAVAGTIRILYKPLPDPRLADRDDLVRWLVTRDLAKESVATRQILAGRLEEEFGTKTDWKAVSGRLDQPRRKMFWKNLMLLLEPWFLAKTDRYFNLPPKDRPAYLDHLIDLFIAWRDIDSLRPDEAETTATPSGQGGILAVLSGRVQQWADEAEPERQKQISQFILAVQMRWLSRSLPQFSTGSG